MDSKARMRTLAVVGMALKPNHVAYVDQKTGSAVVLRHSWTEEDPTVFGAVLDAARRLATSRAAIIRSSVAVYSSKKVLLDVVRYEPVRTKKGSRPAASSKLRLIVSVLDDAGKIIESCIETVSALTDHTTSAMVCTCKT